MTLKHFIIEVAVIFLVDWWFFVSVEHMIPNIWLRFLLIAIIDVFALKKIMPRLRPIFNIPFALLNRLGIRI